jgi:Ca2+-binding RTX toxin-like protein
MPTPRQALRCAAFSMVLTSGLLVSGPPVVAYAPTESPAARSRLRRAALVNSNTARVEALAFDGQGTPGSPVIIEASDVSAFDETASAFDDPNDGRVAQAEAEQTTTVDVADPTATIVRTQGSGSANWADPEPGDDAAPGSYGISRFSLTVVVEDFPASFSLTGSIEAAADESIASCATVVVASPSGSSFQVGSPSCGGPSDGMSVEDSGELEPGTHTFSVVATAPASNPNTTGGTANASFDLSLGLGCSILGTDGPDQLDGTAESDVICGLAGDDTLSGLGGIDLLIGGDGDDTMRGGDGDDLFTGGIGNDDVFGDAGKDLLLGDEGTDDLIGGSGNDLINGDAGNDTIVGDDLEDCGQVPTTSASADKDTLVGSGGDDEIFGCQGRDAIEGGGGDDRINGNSGNDTLTGQAGSDKIHGNDGFDKITGGSRKDVLFGDGENDDLRARDGGRDVVHGGPGTADTASLDSVDQVDGVELAIVCCN